MYISCKGRGGGGKDHPWRKPHEQAKYREQSRSQHKGTKDASHILSLERAAAIQSHSKGRESCAGMKALLNQPANFRMIDKGTNRKSHRDIDKQLSRKRRSSETLTLAEAKRAKQQVGYLQSYQDICPRGFYESAKKDYKSLKTPSHRTLWDERRDKRRRN